MDKCHHFEFPSHLFTGGPGIPVLIEAMCVLVPVRAQVLRVHFAEGAAGGHAWPKGAIG